MAFVRMKKMVNDLEISEENFQEIWTAFENSILNKIHLMKGRHLDQLLMCAIYEFARDRNINIQFEDIKSAYRLQPQAQTDICNSIADVYHRIYVKANGKRIIPFAGFEEQTIKGERIAAERPPSVPYMHKKLRNMMIDRLTN